MKKPQSFKIESDDDLEKIEEDIIKAANKAGKKNVIVNIFTYPHKKLKRRWHVRYKFNKKHLVMDLIIAAGVLVLIGLNVFWFYGGFHYFSNDFNVKVVANTKEFKSGQNVVFDINYSNNNKYELEEVVLGLSFPEYFELKNVSRDSYDYEHNVLTIGDLEPGANGEIHVEGRVIGASEQQQYLVVNLNYYKTDKKGERLWGQFRESEKLEYEIGGSYLEVTADLPKRFVQGQVYDWPIKIINTSDDITYEQISVEPLLSKVYHGMHDGLESFNFGPGDSADFVIPLRIDAGEGNQDFSFDVFWTRDGEQLTQTHWLKKGQIVESKFIVDYDLEIDGEAVTPGDYVPMTLSYQNKGKYTIENIQMELDLSSDYWNTGVIEKENGRLENQKLIWDFKEIARLALLQPGESGEIKFKVKTREYVPGSNALGLGTQLNYSYKLDEQKVQVVGHDQFLKLNSNLSVQAYSMYYAKTGDQLGRGPLPPRVAKENKYWIFAKMINDINDVENVTVSGKLPFNVSWNDKSNVPVGDPIKYDAGTKTLTWQISKVPVDPANIGFAFEVGIIPTAGQIGTYPPLLTDLKITGTDNVTGQTIVKSLGTITTKLIYDDKGKIKDGPVK
ncbi:hypothetical protein HQ571_04605 [Candidatus Kuenenbacteria bacterium]|nr:hypothetical protein [Candidatus Kuenenbacteria bacterium]